ncbi:hypothetical protein [Chlamydia vaughanii]|uniref:hypothetical protein n=1 Tax=Chlamydia vaughanii TaxID=3112552 RepID=UPI0032B1951A
MSSIQFVERDSGVPELSEDSFRPAHPLKALGLPVLIIISIATTLIGALGLAGAGSLPLLIIGSLLIGLSLVAVLSIGISSLLAKKKLESSQEVVNNPPVLTSSGQAALLYAEQQISSQAGVASPEWPSKVLPPINKDITLLLSLAEGKFAELQNYKAQRDQGVSGSSSDAQEGKDFNTLATEYLQLCFAVSYFSLLDLSEYVNQNPDIRSVEHALALDSSCYYRTFYQMSMGYHALRFDDTASPQQSSRFYEEGTPEFQWRELYNSFCEQAALYVGRRDFLERLDSRILKHSTKDLNNWYQHPGHFPVFF